MHYCYTQFNNSNQYFMDPVVHFELPYDDLERAKKFYSEVFGWKIADWPIEDGTTYPGIMTAPADEDNMPLEKGNIGGGMVPKSILEAPAIVMNVDDAEAAAVRAEGSGATRINHKNYPGVGRIYYIKDTEGNLIGLWERFPKEDA